MAYMNKLKSARGAGKGRARENIAVFPPAVGAVRTTPGLVLYPTTYEELMKDAKGRIIKVDNLRGGKGQTAAFTLGGKHGNVVTRSTNPTVVKGWRAVACNGVKYSPVKIGAAVAKAHDKGTTYSVGFIDPFKGAGSSTKLPKIGRAAEALAAAAALVDAEKVKQAAEAQAKAEKRREQQEAKEAAAEIERKATALKTAKEADAAAAAAAAAATAAAVLATAAAEAEIANAELQAKREADAAVAAKQQQIRAQEKEKERIAAATAAASAAAAAAATAAATAAAAAAAAAAHAVVVPPPGEPPRKKIATTGALSLLPAKGDAENPQASLLAAMTGRPPPKPKKKKGGPCDKCDGPHHADDCPHYPKTRVKHDDATARYGGKGGRDGGEGDEGDAESRRPLVVKDGTVVKQPGDGSCLFHSLNHGIPNGAGGGDIQLRRDVADHVEGHPDELIGGTPIRDWVLWDSGLSPKDYAARMRTGNHWGGAIEIAVTARIKGVAVQVFEKSSAGFERISVFGNPKKAKAGVVNLLYSGRCHYDALRLSRL